MSTLSKVLVIGGMSSVGLIIGGLIGLDQGITIEFSAWLQIIIGATGFTAILAVVGGSVLHKKRSNFKRHDDT